MSSEFKVVYTRLDDYATPPRLKVVNDVYIVEVMYWGLFDNAYNTGNININSLEVRSCSIKDYPDLTTKNGILRASGGSDYDVEVFKETADGLRDVIKEYFGVDIKY